jgi:putative SOS response-associated peptidase YedK
VLPTFSILTGEANELMTDIHNSQKRMPLMIDRRNSDAWISDLPIASIIELMNPCDDSAMPAYTISKDIGNPKVKSDVSAIIDKVEYTLF